MAAALSPRVSLRLSCRPAPRQSGLIRPRIVPVKATAQVCRQSVCTIVCPLPAVPDPACAPVILGANLR